MFQINQNCVGCHNCYSECPMQAIDYVGNKYEINQDKCVQCGLCAKVCHTASIIDTEADLSVPQHGLIVKEADVVVCGAGSGIVAAVRAAVEGKKVILLEKSRRLGGNTDYAHGFFPVYARWWKEAGMPDLREEAIQHYNRITDGILGEPVIRTAVYGMSNFFDWVCDLVGDETVKKYFHLVDLGSADAHGPIYGPGLLDQPARHFDNLNCRDDAIGPGYGGTFMKYAMLDAIERLGLNVEIYTEHAAKHLLLDDSGAIRGVIAEEPGGLVQINAPAVILQTGGFGKNDELLKELKPWFFEGRPIHRFSVPTDTGDGILMLRELGVEPRKDRLYVSMFGAKHHPFSNALADIALEPEVIQVNLDGKRWVDEAGSLMTMTPKIAAQPGQISWAIQGREVIKNIVDRFVNNPAFASKAYTYQTWEEEIAEEANLPVPPCAVADTLDELAEKLGMPADALKETVARYNAFCAAGKDEDFGKTVGMIPVPENGPYIAIMGQRFSEASMGGLMVDGDCRVLRNDDTPIPGLYGGGDASSAMHRENDLAVISELTWAFASAYTGAVNAVAYVNEKGGVR